VSIEGPIMDSMDVVKEIKEHAKDRSIKAIILRIDSPVVQSVLHRRSMKK